MVASERPPRPRDRAGRFLGRERVNLETQPRLPIEAGILALAHPTGSLLACWPARDEPVAEVARKIMKAGPAAVTVTDDVTQVTITIETRAVPNGGYVRVWRCPSCGAPRRDLYLLPSVRCRGCAHPRLRFQSEGRAPCRLPRALLAGQPVASLGSRALLTVIRLAAAHEVDREVRNPVLIADPTRAASLFSNAVIGDQPS